MTLTPTDILQIQSAIYRYEKKYPNEPSPSAEVALAWQAGKPQSELRANAVDRGILNHRQILSWIYGVFRFGTKALQR